MMLGELIAALEDAPQERVIRKGFSAPHSYRGDYSELAFEPRENVMIGSMLADARDALGRTFTGYKGGEYVMGEHVDVHLANYGETGEPLGPTLLRYMLTDFDPQAQRPPTTSGDSHSEGEGQS